MISLCCLFCSIFLLSNTSSIYFDCKKTIDYTSFYADFICFPIFLSTTKYLFYFYLKYLIQGKLIAIFELQNRILQRYTSTENMLEKKNYKANQQFGLVKKWNYLVNFLVNKSHQIHQPIV